MNYETTTGSGRHPGINASGLSTTTGVIGGKKNDKIFCPNCERETSGVLAGSETDSDGYKTETYQCHECMEIFERVTMPKDLHMVVCQGCAGAWTFKAPEGKRIEVKLTCQCGAVTEYDSAEREARQ